MSWVRIFTNVLRSFHFFSKWQDWKLCLRVKRLFLSYFLTRKLRKGIRRPRRSLKNVIFMPVPVPVIVYFCRYPISFSLPSLICPKGQSESRWGHCEEIWFLTDQPPGLKKRVHNQIRTHIWCWGGGTDIWIRHEMCANFHIRTKQIRTFLHEGIVANIVTWFAQTLLSF